MADVRGGEPRQLRVAMVGYAFMGAAHSQAWRTAPRFFDLPAVPAMAVLCGRDARRLRPPRPSSAGQPPRPTGAS